MRQKIFTLTMMLCCALCVMAQTQEIRVFAHRGGRMEQDENTLQAFKASWAIGFHGFETDVHMSKDGVLYIMHDSSLERTTTSSGKIEEMLSADLDKVVSKKGNPMLRMDDLVKFFDGKDSLYVEWEMKTTDHNLYPQDRMEDYVEKVYKAVSKIRTKGSTLLFTSFDYRPLRYLQEHHPDAELLLISGKPINDETINTAVLTGIKTIGCTMDGTSRAMVAKAHKAGLTVSLWPGNSVNDLVLGAYLGADRLCTDIPGQVKQWAGENVPWLKLKF